MCIWKESPKSVRNQRRNKSEWKHGAKTNARSSLVTKWNKMIYLKPNLLLPFTRLCWNKIQTKKLDVESLPWYLQSHSFLCLYSFMNCDLEFDSPHVKAELHSHINFYRQLVQWWRIRKFFLLPNTNGSPAGNWYLPAAGRHWATAALSSLAGGEDNSELLLCHCKVKLQSSAALFVLPERYGSKSIYSREMKTHNYEDQTMAAITDGLCIKQLLTEISRQSAVFS